MLEVRNYLYLLRLYHEVNEIKTVLGHGISSGKPTLIIHPGRMMNNAFVLLGQLDIAESICCQLLDLCWSPDKASEQTSME